MAHSTSPALAAVCRRSRGSVRFHSVLQAVFHKRAQANKKGCYTRKSALGPAPGGLRQPQAGGHLRWATAASYKPEVQSGRGLCQPQARSGSHCQPGLPPQPSGSRSAGPAATAFWFRVSRACRHRLSDPVGYASRKPGVISGGPCHPSSYKPEVQSGRGLCQPQARVRSGGLCQPAKSLGFSRGVHDPGSLSIHPWVTTLG